MRNATSGSSGGMREGRVLSRSRPSTPSAMNRSCHLQTKGFDFPVRRTISTVPAPSAVARMIPARPTCRCRLGRAPASPRRGALAFRLVRTSPSTPPAAGSAPRAALPSPKPPTQSPWRLHPAGPASGDFPSALPRTSACLYAGRREPHTPAASRCRGSATGSTGCASVRPVRLLEPHPSWERRMPCDGGVSYETVTSFYINWLRVFVASHIADHHGRRTEPVPIWRPNWWRAGMRTPMRAYGRNTGRFAEHTSASQ